MLKRFSLLIQWLDDFSLIGDMSVSKSYVYIFWIFLFVILGNRYRNSISINNRTATSDEAQDMAITLSSFIQLFLHYLTENKSYYKQPIFKGD